MHAAGTYEKLRSRECHYRLLIGVKSEGIRIHGFSHGFRNAACQNDHLAARLLVFVLHCILQRLLVGHVSLRTRGFYNLWLI